jgi:DNA/RNA endonuclease G (NUC1)
VGQYEWDDLEKGMTRKLSILTLLLIWFFTTQPAQATVDVSLQMQLGNPSGAISDTNNLDNYLIQRTVEALDYSDNLGEPVWASWDLTANDIGTNSRSSFIIDTNLPPNFTRYSTSIYNNTGWDRGHLCPSKDRTDTSTNNDLVFLMSNVLPQSGVNNSGVWLQFENYCRDLVQSTNNYELLLLCGGSGYGSARLTNGPFIPDYVWKIAVVVPPGAGMATNRITTTNRVIAIKVPNNDSATNIWPFYVTSANQIQVDTGLIFFTALAPDIAGALRAKVDGQTNPPPIIFAFSPLSGAILTNVVITGTNFSLASAVTFNGANAAFNVDSATQITATVPTNAGSGFISVTTSSGTAISTNTFTVLNNGGTVYSGVLIGWDVSGLPGGLNNYGPSPFTPTTNAPNLSVIGLTRGSGVKQSGTAGAGGWGGTGFTNLTAATAIASNLIVTFSVTASNGYKVSFSSVSHFDYYHSPSGPTNGVLQYQLGTNAFVDITNLNYATASSGTSIGAIDLSSFTGLQNIGANTNITFRIVNMNGGSAGTWYIYDKVGTTALDLAVQGTVTQVLGPPASQPTFSAITFTNNRFSFSLTGTAGTNYVVQATTNLSPATWITLKTNASPFTFIDTNVEMFKQRFYQGLVAP